MARTAAAHTKFVAVAREDNFRDYNVEIRQGQVRRTVGRISGSRRGPWVALPVGATAWTRWHVTRAAAWRALQAREDFRYPHTYITT